MITIYKCEICGKESTNKDEIVKCENKGCEKPLFNIGDEIILSKNALNEILCRDFKYLDKIDAFKENVYKNIKLAILCCNNVFIIKNIMQDGHIIKYELSFKEYGNNIKMFTDYVYIFPMIYGNDELNKFLQLNQKEMM